MCFNVIFKPLLLTPRGRFPSTSWEYMQDLLWEARVRHAINMAGPPELVLSDGGRDGGNVGLFQDAGVGVPILPADP